MGVAELDIEMDSELIAHTRNLAVRYFSDESDASLARVLEMAFRLRYFWSRSIIKGQQEIDEVVSRWEFPESQANGENMGPIQNWLFKR